ncbi:MAG: hypothetical protein E6J65_08520 [Deltaproteobacteria bacterium]|nr:MAG: hypothetical protein E6J65_08520 [Deltaproteobacteria bacterium]
MPQSPTNRPSRRRQNGVRHHNLSLNVNADYGRQSGNQYWGVAGMARYSFLDDTFRISGRGEYLDDSDGATGITNPAGATLRNKYWEGTLSWDPAGWSVSAKAARGTRRAAR